MLSLRTHHIFDYILGAFLLVAPWIFGFAEVAAARNLMLALGIIVIAYSLITNSYYSVAHKLPLGAHMLFDSLIGIALILGPAYFNYRTEISNAQYAAHIILGLFAISLVAVTSPRTEAAKTPAERADISNDLAFSRSDRKNEVPIIQ